MKTADRAGSRPCATASPPPGGRRNGQTLIVLILSVVILTLCILWNVDLHNLVRVRSLSQNGGDSAALMAARWQGTTLNLVGGLNVLQALAIGSGNPAAGEAINNVQARLCFVGPMIALMGAQQAAKNNRLYSNPGFTQRVREHAMEVRNEYPALTGPDGESLFPEPYAGCWQEYADMLDLIADEGVAAGADNARFYADASGGHTLLTPAFYEAVASMNWCWFLQHAPNLLPSYTDFHWWPDISPRPPKAIVDCEFFSLGLRTVHNSLEKMGIPQEIRLKIQDWGADWGVPGRLPTHKMKVYATWYCYAPSRWHSWSIMSVEGERHFPITGPVKPQYDYAGADAAIRVEASAGRLTPLHGQTSRTNTVTWTAAAKPFGFLDEETPPHRYGLVLPTFYDVRLIPIDASSTGAGGAFDLEWRRHIDSHLPEYLRDGTVDAGCWYCRQLTAWEVPDFRQLGEQWLLHNADLCTPSDGGGGGGGEDQGGTRRGH